MCNSNQNVVSAPRGDLKEDHLTQPRWGVLSRKQWSGILEHEKGVTKQRRKEQHRLRLTKAQESQKVECVQEVGRKPEKKWVIGQQGLDHEGARLNPETLKAQDLTYHCCLLRGSV